MDTFSEVFGRFGNGDLDSWLQVYPWQQSITSGQGQAPAGVSVTTTTNVIVDVVDSRRLPSTPGNVTSSRGDLPYHYYFGPIYF